jgi:hypothetical protein
LLLITALLGYPVFETAALYSLVFVLIAMPAVLFTGYTVWQKRYRGAMTSLFKMKIGASAVSFVLSCSSLLSGGLHAGCGGRTFWWAMVVHAPCPCLLGAVGLAGHLGGKLVFGPGRIERCRELRELISSNFYSYFCLPKTFI